MIISSNNNFFASNDSVPENLIGTLNFIVSPFLTYWKSRCTIFPNASLCTSFNTQFSILSFNFNDKTELFDPSKSINSLFVICHWRRFVVVGQLFWLGSIKTLI